MATYELWYTTSLGERLAPITDVIAFQYVKVIGDVGFATLAFPRRGQVYEDVSPDRRIEIYRRPDGGVLALEIVIFLDRFIFSTDKRGQSHMKLSGGDPTGLLSRRIIAYYAGSAQAGMTDSADDMMKALVTDQLIDNADYSGTPDPTRSIDAWLDVESDVSAGSTLTKSFAWKNLLTSLKGIQASSKTQGTEVFFAVVPTENNNFEFRTYTGQPGLDRTVGADSVPLVFSPEWGNLIKPELEYDYSVEANMIYAGGQGQEDDREVQTAIDTTRAGASAFARREKMYNASSADSAGAVTAAANDALARNRRKLTLSGELVSTPRTPYGGLNGWNLGDKVTVSYAGLQFDTIIRVVNVRVNERGKETVTSRIENVNA
jgi:hypothetical protein